MIELHNEVHNARIYERLSLGPLRMSFYVIIIIIIIIIINNISP